MGCLFKWFQVLKPLPLSTEASGLERCHGPLSKDRGSVCVEESPCPPKSGIRALLLTTTAGKSEGQAVKIPGRGEVLFFLADADTWPPLTSPQTASLSTDTASFTRAPAVCVPKVGSHFRQVSQLLAQPNTEGQQLLGEAASGVGGASAPVYTARSVHCPGPEV